MAMEKTLGGDRLGAGKRQKVYLHGYERSTHDLGYIFRSTMAAGTLVPFMSEVALPGDTFDINLDCDVKTHPTIGPLFGSYKVQLDVFLTPIRLYQGQLHNNKVGIGMNMSNIKLPTITLIANPLPNTVKETLDSAQINPSCLLAYLGIRGVGNPNELGGIDSTRDFNAVPILTYWDIYKQYYSNKQEEIGAVIHNTIAGIEESITDVDATWSGGSGTADISQFPAVTPVVPLVDDTAFVITFSGTPPALTDIVFNLADGSWYTFDALTIGAIVGTTTITGQFNFAYYGYLADIVNWNYRLPQQAADLAPTVVTFPLSNIDDMREMLLEYTTQGTAVSINMYAGGPYEYLHDSASGFPYMMNNQEGLGIKTYQSDLFNNWLSTEWIDGAGGITELTAIDTSSGEFTLDTLNLAKKVYMLLNRIAVSGGTYDDWIDAAYTHERYKRAETPIYMGGLSKELVFQEVVSNTESAEGAPLGTLAGKGVMAKKHKGGYIHIGVDEPSYITGIVSLTPRIDYSQGNKWDVHLMTMDDLHKPALDEIGFQELITEQMAWWETYLETSTTPDTWVQRSAGKQPAWINYMTNHNRVYGNFAIATNEMFMTLNRRYEPVLADTDKWRITDLTTYIDPVKYNHIFAETARDAQNFWTQISVDITARRKMSAKVMPNL